MYSVPTITETRWLSCHLLLSYPCALQDCVLSEYGDYSPCSVTCGDGTRARDRNVLQEASGNGRACEPLQEVEVCNLGSCSECCLCWYL